MLERNGCEKDAPQPLFQDFMGLGILKNITRCPEKMLTLETRQIMAIFNQCYSSGEGGLHLNNLPGAGGLLNQSHTLMAAMSIIASTIQKIWLKKRPSNG